MQAVLNAGLAMLNACWWLDLPQLAAVLVLP